jgi:hypothetical protein
MSPCKTVLGINWVSSVAIKAFAFLDVLVGLAPRKSQYARVSKSSAFHRNLHGNLPDFSPVYGLL